jgi:hypothetical protein
MYGLGWATKLELMMKASTIGFQNLIKRLNRWSFKNVSVEITIYEQFVLRSLQSTYYTEMFFNILVKKLAYSLVN